MKRVFVNGFGVLLLTVSSAAMAEIYKCTDAQGTTRYADKPCSDTAVTITPGKAPVISEDSLQRQRKTQRLLRAFDAEHEEQRAKEAAIKAEKIQRQEACARAKHYQRGVTQASRVYAYDEDGQRYDLSHEGRAAEEVRAQKQVEHWCDEK